MGFSMMNWWTFRNTILLWYHFVCCTMFSSEIYVYLKLWILSLWQIGPNLSTGIRWCLALASVRPPWCLLRRFLMCVHVCVPCEWWSGPCMCDESLLNSCYVSIVVSETLGFIKCCASVVPAMFAQVVCSDLIWVPLRWCQFLSGVVNFLVIFAVFKTVWIY